MQEQYFKIAYIFVVFLNGKKKCCIIAAITRSARLDLSNNHKGSFTLNFFANHFFNYTPVISHFSL